MHALDINTGTEESVHDIGPLGLGEGLVDVLIDLEELEGRVSGLEEGKVRHRLLPILMVLINQIL